MGSVRIRFYLDPETGEPHVYNHEVSEDEVEEVFRSGEGQDRASREGSRMLMGRTETGRHIRVVSTPDPDQTASS